MSTVSRQQYASLYGPTAGDRFRLADTELIAQVERRLLLRARKQSTAAARPCATAWVKSRGSATPTAHWT